MTDRLLIGVDVGTHVLKAAVLDAETGAMVAQAAHRLPVEVDDDGRRETLLADVDHTLDGVMATLRAGCGDRWSAVAGVGMATQGGSSIVCDCDTGQALTPMALWNDGRCHELHAQVAAERPASYWRGYSLRDEPGAGLARLRWLAATQPGLLAPGRIYGGVGEYLVKRLTGVWRQDACNAAQIGIYNAVEGRLDGRALQGRGPGLEAFAPLRSGHEMHPLTSDVANAWGLPSGIPVAGPYNDHEAGYASIVDSCPGSMLVSLGTAWVGTLPPATASPTAFGFVLPAPTGEGVILIQPLLTGNVTWDWALEQFVHPDRETALRLSEAIFAETILPPYGLVGIPWLNRPNPLAGAALGAASLFGISPATTRHDMLRAVACGMVFEFRRVLGEGAVCHTGGMVLAGGAARGRHFRQLFQADGFAIDKWRATDDNWMGVRGSLYGFETAASAVPVELVEPDGSLAVNDVKEHEGLYGRVFDALYSGVAAGEPYGAAK